MIWESLIAPLTAVPWGHARDFWLAQVLDDRFVIVFFIPLLAPLLAAPRTRLRMVIVATGLAFLAYLCGVLYAALWLATCLLLHRLGEYYARRADRSATLLVIALVGGWYIATMLLGRVCLPPSPNAWLFEHVPWIFPYGARGAAWEPVLSALHHAPGDGGPFQLVHALFWNVHYIGSAYLAARMLHYFAELRRGTLPAPLRTRLNFLAYACYAPALLQGPLERFATFQAELDACHTRRTWRNVPPAAARIALGLLKSVGVTLYLLPTLEHLATDNLYYEHPDRVPSFWLLYTGVFLQTLGLYLEFSGYCDVSAGLARLLGYRQIENFRRPWLATSLRDLWRRWHISLSEILRDYVYIPLGGNRRHTALNLCLTFVLCGLWHSLSLKAAVWGLVMGLLVAANHQWTRWLARLDQNPARPLARLRRAVLRCQPLPRLGAWLLTQHAFVFSLLVFFGGRGALRVLGELLRRLAALFPT